MKKQEEKKSLGMEMAEIETALGAFIVDPLVLEILQRHEAVLKHLVSIVEELTNKSRFDLK